MTATTALRIACSALVLAAASTRAAEPSSPPPTVQAPSSAAAPRDARDDYARGRVLNGHVFMPSQTVPGALLTTSFVSNFIAGLGNTTASRTVGDQTFSGTFDYAAVGAQIAYEHTFLDYFSARAGFTEQLFSGTSGRSIVVVGSELRAGVAAGVTASLPIGDSLRVGALLDVSYAPNVALTIGTAIQSVIDSCSTPAGSAACDPSAGATYELRNVLSLQPALAANWAPLPALGLTGNAAYVHVSQEVNDVSQSGDAMVLGAAADFDFKAISPVPVGLQAVFSWTAPSGTVLDHLTDVGGGIFYTGRRELSLGFQLVARRFAVAPLTDVSWSTYLMNIGVRYYW